MIVPLTFGAEVGALVAVDFVGGLPVPDVAALVVEPFAEAVDAVFAEAVGALDAAALAVGAGSLEGAGSAVVAAVAVGVGGASAVVEGGGVAVAVGVSLGSVAAFAAFDAPSGEGCFDRQNRKPPATPPAITRAIAMPARIGPRVEGCFVGFAEAIATAAFDAGLPDVGGAVTFPGIDTDAALKEPGVMLCCIDGWPGKPIDGCDMLGCEEPAAAL